MTILTTTLGIEHFCIHQTPFMHVGGVVLTNCDKQTRGQTDIHGQNPQI